MKKNDESLKRVGTQSSSGHHSLSSSKSVTNLRTLLLVQNKESHEPKRSYSSTNLSEKAVDLRGALGFRILDLPSAHLCESVWPLEKSTILPNRMRLEIAERRHLPLQRSASDFDMSRKIGMKDVKIDFASAAQSSRYKHAKLQEISLKSSRSVSEMAVHQKRSATLPTKFPNRKSELVTTDRRRDDFKSTPAVGKQQLCKTASLLPSVKPVKSRLSSSYEVLPKQIR